MAFKITETDEIISCASPEKLKHIVSNQISRLKEQESSWNKVLGGGEGKKCYFTAKKLKLHIL